MTVTIPTFLGLLLPLYIAYYYTAYSWEVVLPVIAYGGPSTVNTEVHAFRVLRLYLTHIGGTKISFGNHLIIPLVTKGEGMTNKKECFQALVVAREFIRGDRISESMEAHAFVSHTMALI